MHRSRRERSPYEAGSHASAGRCVTVRAALHVPEGGNHENDIDRGRRDADRDVPGPARQDAPSSGSGPPGASAKRAEDEKAIAALAAAYAKAFNAGDAAAAAATFAEDALIVDELGRADRGPRAHPGSTGRGVRGQTRQQDRHRDEGPAFPRPRHGARGGPDDHHAGRGRVAGDHPLHRRPRQARWPMAPVGRPRRARPRPHPPRAPQGTGVDGRGLGQREPGCGRPHHLQVGRRRQLPGPRVHHEVAGPAGALGHAADRLGPDP